MYSFFRRLLYLMATIIPFPLQRTNSPSGLTDRECEIIHAEAFALMQKGHATGISIHEKGRFMCVFDCQGEPYLIGREQGVCFMSNADATLIAHSDSFEYALGSLRTVLLPEPKVQV